MKYNVKAEIYTNHEIKIVDASKIKIEGYENFNFFIRKYSEKLNDSDKYTIFEKDSGMTVGFGDTILSAQVNSELRIKRFCTCDNDLTITINKMVKNNLNCHKLNTNL